MPCKNPPPCPKNYSYYKLSNEKMCCRKNTSAKTKFPLSDAKRKLRVLYAMDLNGKIRSPAFITKLTGVPGRGGAEKIANIRRTLSTCKKMGVPIVSSSGKKFKTYRTLVTQCKVSLKKTPGAVHLSNLIAKIKKRKAQSPLRQPLLSAEERTRYAPIGEQPDFIDLSDLGDYVPPPMVSGFGKKSKRKGMEFGKKRKSVRKSKIPKKILKMCKKLKIKVSMKRGSKRVYKKLSVLKKEIKRKLKMQKKTST